MVSPWRKFDEFIASVDKEYSFRHPAFFGARPSWKQNIRLNDPRMGLSQNKFGYYFVGLEV
jgi:hypothetical protein